MRDAVFGSIAGTAADADADADLAALIERYLSRPAGLVRPRLLAASAHQYGGQRRARGIAEPLVELGAATELLHVFALMHDDRIDADKAERYFATPDDAVLRLLAGDLIHTVALDLLAHAVIDHRLNPLILTEVRSVSIRTIIGQVQDMRFLCTEGREEPTFERLYQLYDDKTGWYTVAAPLRIGALAAGAEQTELDLLTAMAVPLGRAYQLRDDVRDLTAILRSTDGTRRHPRWELNLAATWLAFKGRPWREILDSADLPISLIDEEALAIDIGARIADLRREAESAAARISAAPGRAVTLFGRLLSILDL